MAKVVIFAQTKRGLILQSAVSLALSYAFISRAIDTGSLWQYLVGLILLIMAGKFFIRTLKK